MYTIIYSIPNTYLWMLRIKEEEKGDNNLNIWIIFIIFII